MAAGSDFDPRLGYGYTTTLTIPGEVPGGTVLDTADVKGWSILGGWS